MVDDWIHRRAVVSGSLKILFLGQPIPNPGSTGRTDAEFKARLLKMGELQCRGAGPHALHWWYAKDAVETGFIDRELCDPS
jgi:hypothetical protein